MKRLGCFITRQFYLVMLTGAVASAAFGKGEKPPAKIITNAPSGQYSLIQMENSEGNCHTTIHFRDTSKPDKILPDLVDADNEVLNLGCANFLISPDERWFVDDQHIGAGSNDLRLFEVTGNGEIQEVEDNLIELGLKCVLDDLRRKHKKWGNMKAEDFDHHAGENVMWSSISDVLTFDVFARADPLNPKAKSYPSIKQSIDYNVNAKKITIHSGKRKMFDAALASEWTGEAKTNFNRGTTAIFARWQCNVYEYHLQQHPNDVDGAGEPKKIRVVWIAEDTSRTLPRNNKLDEATVTTKRFDDFGTFVLARPENGWIPGMYRAQFYIDGKLIDTVEFSINK